MTRVAVSILNYQSAESTIACVQGLLTAAVDVVDTCQLDIVVADNASGIEEQTSLKESLQCLPNVYFLGNPENLGFAAGHNRNLQRIFSQSSPDYIWLLNNDCLVARDALHELVEHAQNYPAVGIWGATLLEPDARTIQCAGGCFYNPWTSSYRQYGRGRAVKNLDQLKSVEFDYVAGASLFFPVSTLLSGLRVLTDDQGGSSQIRQEQWLNENFFLYFEELDLAQRLSSGLKMAWCRKALITHAGGVSTGASGKRRSAQAEYHSTLSALKFTRLYFPGKFWFMAPFRYFAKCTLLVLRGDLHLIRHLSKAYLDYFNR